MAGTRAEGCLQWFGGLDKPKRQKALIDLVNGDTDGKVPEVLVKARSRKKGAGKGPR
ncbi:MAG TPA: hypothetical protein VFS16_10225 [Acidimicrobiia bacterium]|nr:hypothetical protein [Acidimicrobiia bacterium]